MLERVSGQEMEDTVARPVRIGNFSGFLGDRFTALTEILHGGDVDIVMGDYLAEATMAGVSSLFRGNATAQQDFFAAPFLQQIEPELGFIAEKGIKVVVNAGAFNPRGLAEALRAMIAKQNLNLSVAFIEGDDVLAVIPELQASGDLHHLDSGEPLNLSGQTLVAANAYLGGWGIVEALKAGADIVIGGRISDASLVAGPAAWWHDWDLDAWDRLAGAVIAGHVIECGPQPSGGNFSGFETIPDRVVLGFPINPSSTRSSSALRPSSCRSTTGSRPRHAIRDRSWTVSPPLIGSATTRTSSGSIPIASRSWARAPAEGSPPRSPCTCRAMTSGRCSFSGWSTPCSTTELWNQATTSTR